MSKRLGMKVKELEFTMSFMGFENSLAIKSTLDLQITKEGSLKIMLPLVTKISAFNEASKNIKSTKFQFFSLFEISL